MSKLRFALIGCGRISAHHLQALIDNYKEAELVAVCDLIKEKAEVKANEYLHKTEEVKLSIEKPRVFTDYQKMLQEEDIEVYSICTESGYHAEIALNCINKKKHILVEKPMTLSLSEADKMIREAEKNKVKLAVCYQNRFNPTIQKLMQSIKEGRFGRIIAVTARILWNRNKDYYKQAKWRGTWKLDGGCLMNQCSHSIDLVQWIIGEEIESVFSQIENFFHPYNETEDYGSIVIRFKNKTIGNVEGTVCIYPENLEETITVIGEKGTVVIGGLALNEIKVWNFQDNKDSWEEVGSKCNTEISNVYGKGHTPLYENFIHSIKENKIPLIDGREGKKSLNIILMAYQSQKENQPIIYQRGLKISTLDFIGLLEKD